MGTCPRFCWWRRRIFDLDNEFRKNIFNIETYDDNLPSSASPENLISTTSKVTFVAGSNLDYFNAKVVTIGEKPLESDANMFGDPYRLTENAPNLADAAYQLLLSCQATIMVNNPMNYNKAVTKLILHLMSSQPALQMCNSL